jgi:hypothetical protein
MSKFVALHESGVGTFETSIDVCYTAAFEGFRTLSRRRAKAEFDPERPSAPNFAVLQQPSHGMAIVMQSAASDWAATRLAVEHVAIALAEPRRDAAAHPACA